MGLQINKDVNYGPAGSPLSSSGVDCYWFNETPASPRACVVFIHGGGWAIGDKMDHRNDCLRVAQKFQVNAFTVNYLLGANSYPGNVNLLESFLQWLLVAPCCDSAKILLVGISAGGHLATWVACNFKEYIRAVLNICGPLDLTVAGGNPPALLAAADSARGEFSAEEFSPAHYMTPENKPGIPHIWDIRGRLDQIVTDGAVFRDKMENLSSDSRQIQTQDQHAIFPTSLGRFDWTIDAFVAAYK